MTKCVFKDCNLDAYDEETSCVLHCSKSYYSDDFDRDGLLSSFYEELINYIVDQTFGSDADEASVNREDARKYLRTVPDSVDSNLHEKLNKSPIHFKKIRFPACNSIDSFDYRNIFNGLRGIRFNQCKFMVTDLASIRASVYFQGCRFQDVWTIYDQNLLENYNSAIYRECTFTKEVDVSAMLEERQVIRNSLFCNCSFEEGLELTNIQFENSVFENTSHYASEIRNLSIKDCIFSGRFVLNLHTVKILEIESSIFHEKMEAKHNSIGLCEIYDTNFEKTADFYASSFETMFVKKGIFYDFLGFEKCKFGLEIVESDNKEEGVARYDYVTFLGIANFRKAKFGCGLDIKNTNFKDQPNFLDANISATNTNRETFRIVKNSFDAVGNHIEANKHFAQEMRKYREELKGSKRYQEIFIFNLNSMFSDFGQSYVRPSLWLVLSSAFYSLIVYGYEKNALYKIHPSLNDQFESVANIFNSLASNMLPVSRFLAEGMQFVSLIFYTFISILLWQTIVAVKRHTRR